MDEFISEQQKDIVYSTAKYKLINGCAGSHKTDTLIKCAIRDLIINKRPILFLTLVMSVTYEIKSRLEKYLKIDINQIGRSNHFKGYYETQSISVPIVISNYDAWIHFMIQDDSDINEIGSQWDRKIDRLLIRSQEEENLICYMKTYSNGSSKTELLILDEAQDLDSKKMEILVNIAAKQTDLDFYIAGDLLQTIYGSNTNLKGTELFAMNIFKQLNPSYFDLNKCMRCPKAHIDFNNLIMNRIQEKYGIPPILSSNNDILNKPMLFTHRASTNNADAIINANQITDIIKILMEKDLTIKPNDIAIIMAKSKDNHTYIQLENTLSEFYKSKGYINCVQHMNTDADGYHRTLDWTSVEEKTIMLSIHGDKGKGHKVVFFLGLTEKSIPKENYIFKPSEILAESLLNVGITRSLQYLFIGFTYSYPSRYLYNYKDKLHEFAYLAWNKDNNMPEPYAAIQRRLNSSQQETLPKWDISYENEPIKIGDKSNLKIKNDLSKDFEHINEFLSYNWTELEEAITFGQKQNIKIHFHEIHSIFLGVMTELLIQRIIYKDNLFKFLRDSNNEEYTKYEDDEQLLTFMHDVNKFIQ